MRNILRRLPPAGRVLTIVLLAGIVYATWWWLGEQRETPAVRTARQPDSYFKELELIRHDAAGQPEMRVTARYAEHFEDEAWVHLETLVATGLEAGPEWRLSAAHGRLDDNGVTLEAWEDVVLTRGDDDNTGTRLETERLHVNTETEIATTDATVTITQGAGSVRGDGLWASLADDRIRLESNVEARYGK